MKNFAAGCALTAMALASSSAWSQTADQRVMAETLFREGKRLMAEGQLAEACPKLQESQRLDPGGGTLLNLALCHEREGRTATAWAEYGEAVSMAKRDGRTDRLQLATESMNALEPKLRRVTVSVAPQAQIEGLEVKLDGVVLRKASWGMAVPLDPGEHEVVASAPRMQPWKSSVRLDSDGQHETVQVPRLTPLPAAPIEAMQDSSSTQRTVAYVLGGVGVVGLAAGTFFGIRAFDKDGESDELCQAGCSDRAVQLSDEASTAATWSNVSFGVGLVGLGAATYLLWTAPSQEQAAGKVELIPAAAHADAGVTVRATW